MHPALYQQPDETPAVGDGPSSGGPRPKGVAVSFIRLFMWSLVCERGKALKQFNQSPCQRLGHPMPSRPFSLLLNQGVQQRYAQASAQQGGPEGQGAKCGPRIVACTIEQP